MGDFLFLIETGLRRSEALNAQWYKDGIISIIGKGQRQRLVPARRLPSITQKDLNNLIKVLQSVRPGLRLHDIRHTYAYTLLMNNVDLRTIQLLLGHKNINTTIIYLRLDISSMQKKIEDINFLQNIKIPTIMLEQKL